MRLSLSPPLSLHLFISPSFSFMPKYTEAHTDTHTRVFTLGRERGERERRGREGERRTLSGAGISLSPLL